MIWAVHDTQGSQGKAKLAKTVVGAAGIALLSLSGAALAEGNKFEWSVTASGTSDYVFRGYSYNNEDPAFQSSIDLAYGIWYLGLWGTIADKDYAGGPVELNLYGGVKPVWGPITFDFGFLYYFFPWTTSPSDADLIELKAGLEFSPIKNLTITPVYWYIPDQGIATLNDDHSTIEGTIAYELPAVGIVTPTVSSLLGYTEFGDYTYWNAGISLAVEKFNFDFRYWDTDIAGDGLADERFVFTTSITLP